MIGLLKGNYRLWRSLTPAKPTLGGRHSSQSIAHSVERSTSPALGFFVRRIPTTSFWNSEAACERQVMQVECRDRTMVRDRARQTQYWRIHVFAKGCIAEFSQGCRQAAFPVPKRMKTGRRITRDGSGRIKTSGQYPNLGQPHAPWFYVLCAP
jgi:hypothetical protein